MKRSKIIPVVICAVFLALISSVTAWAAVMGDIDGNGKTEASDARTALRAAVGLDVLTGDKWHIADADANKNIEASDARLILRAAVGLEEITAVSEHSFGEWLTVTPASTGKDGLEKHACPLCGIEETRIIPALLPDDPCAKGHSWDKGKVTKAATCSEEGSMLYTCTVCGSTKNEAIPVDSSAHKWDNGAVTKAATCTAAGEKTYKCLNDPKHTKTEPIPADSSAHKWDNGAVTKAATCTAAGEKTYKCLNDPKHTKTEQIPVDSSAHQWDSGVLTSAPTCTKTGVMTYTCLLNKNHTKTESVPTDSGAHKYNWTKTTSGCKGVCTYNSRHTVTLDHIWDDGNVTKNATCTENGTKTFTCTHCGQTKTSSIAKLGHAYGAWTSVSATQHARVCGNDASHKETASHSFSTVTTPSTCTVAGSKVSTCSVCGYKKTETLALAAHKLTRIAAKSATCTEAGNMQYWSCSVCNKLFSNSTGTKETTPENVRIAPTGHTMTRYAAKSPTCTSAGNYEYYYCSVCKKTFSDVGGVNEISASSVTLAATGHSLTRVPAKESTCVEQGNIEYYACSVCGKLYSNSAATKEIKLSDTVKALKNHTFNATVIDEKYLKSAATCEKPGEYYKSCSVCGKSAKNETLSNYFTVPALGHDYSIFIGYENNQAPTCTASAYAIMKCSRCSKTNKDTKIDKDPNAHPENKIINTYSDLNEPTCTEKGSYYLSTYCTACKNVVEKGKKIEVDKIPHDLVFVPAVEATCYSKGNIAYYECGTCHNKFSDPNGEDIITGSVVTNELAHDFSVASERYYTAKTTCTADGKYYEIKYCKNKCGTILYNGNNYSASEFAAYASTGEGVLTENALGHDIVYFVEQQATCTEAERTEGYGCSRCDYIQEGMNTVGGPLGHNYTLSSEECVFNTSTETFFCTRCSKLTDNVYSTYNDLVNNLKLNGYGNNLLTYFTKNVSQTKPLGYKTTGIVNIIPGIREELETSVSQTTTSFTAGSKKIRNQLYRQNEYVVNLLAENEFSSIQVRKINGLQFSQLLDSSYGSTITTNGFQWDVNEFRKRSENSEIIEVSVKIKPETYTPSGGIPGVANDQDTILQKFNGTDIRMIALEGYGESGQVVSDDSDDTMTMVSTLTLKSIRSDADATFYFRVSDLKPIAAVYNMAIDSSQTAKMEIAIGISSGSMTIDTQVIDTTQDVFLFN